MYSQESGSEDFYRYMYYYQASRIAQLNAEFYVDLFLLWLLYRFMKPQKIFVNGKTEASTLLFAHDG